jgi:hypothetical protein
VYYDRWRSIQLKIPNDPKLADMDRKIADLEAQINELRKPVSHHFVIKPTDQP